MYKQYGEHRFLEKNNEKPWRPPFTWKLIKKRSKAKSESSADAWGVEMDEWKNRNTFLSNLFTDFVIQILLTLFTTFT